MVGAAVAVGAAVGRPLRRIIQQNEQMARRNDEFREDWYGTAARPGRDAEPGVMERLKGIEARQGRVESQLVTNGGSSLRDAVNRIESEQKRLRSQFEESLRITGAAAATQVVVNPQPLPDHY